ncbi:hypothetical protein C815_01960 [Firmicutes bacterium M10-2]|nr:hypothetical protein C815_01960 [Firmicutes bacterium M10-2]
MNHKSKKPFLLSLTFVLLFIIAGIFFVFSQIISVKNDLTALYQFDERWKNEPYGTSDLQTAGCAPTCLAMVFSYLNQDQGITPVTIARFSEENGHYIDGTGTSWSLFADAAIAYGIEEQEISPYESEIDQALEENKNVIASMVPGHFTSTGHFIVLSGIENGQYRVFDPNSQERSTLWDKAIVLDEMIAAWGFWKH